jgi:pimeloyl-ACP methyl ester carboxylesterase
MVAELAHLTLAQKLLLSRAGPLVGRLSSKRFFVQQFGSVFSESHPLSEEEADDQWSLVCAGGGRTQGHHQVAYYRQRIENADRWHGALREWDGELHYVWGLEDPVATTAMFEAVQELRPHAPATPLPGLGHYPQLEDPPRVAEAVRRLVTAAG